MNHGGNSRTMAQVVLTAAGLIFTGCTTTGHRNLADAIIVTAPPSLIESETKIVLELRDDREDLLLSEVDAFLASERAAKLGRAVRSQLRERGENLRRTMPQARQEWTNGLAIIRPNPSRAFVDGNIVIYIANDSGVRVLFSRAEIGQLLASKECADDLATIRYTHPGFDSARLGVLRDRVAALDSKVENISPSKPEVERLRTEAATRVLERYLRDNGLLRPEGSPLLTSGLLSSMRSPKLTEALKDRSVVERILQDHNPNALRAMVFLVNRNVIELGFP